MAHCWFHTVTRESTAQLYCLLDTRLLLDVLNGSVPLCWSNNIRPIRTGLDYISALGTFVVERVGVDVDDPVPIYTTFVCTTRTVERCLVRRLTLSVAIGGDHSHTYYLIGDKGAVLGLLDAIEFVSLGTTKSRL